jgi:hypothetical protein
MHPAKKKRRGNQHLDGSPSRPAQPAIFRNVSARGHAGYGIG